MIDMSKYVIDNGFANLLNEIEKQSLAKERMNVFGGVTKEKHSTGVCKRKLICRTEIVENLNVGAIVKS